MVAVRGYGIIGKVCAIALQHDGARVGVTEINPICALEAAMEGILVVKLEDVVSNADLFVKTTGNRDIIRLNHMKKKKHNSIICNMSTSN